MKRLVSVRATRVVVLIAALGMALPRGYAQAALAGDLRDQFHASKTSKGILITSVAKGNHFTLELTGKEIKPTDSDRISLLVDGLVIELGTVPVSSTTKVGADALVASPSVLAPYFKDWSMMQGSEETFSFPSGQKCLYWELTSARTQGDGTNKRQFVSTLNGAYIVYLLASVSSNAAQEAQAKVYLKTSLLTLKSLEEQPSAGSDGKPSPRRLKLSDIHIVYNKDLMTPEEEQPGNGIGLPTDELLETARLAIDLDQQLIADVTDGHTVHAITLTGYSLKDGTFEYWDPRGTSSFLEARNNIAGVNAASSASKERSWIVKSDELARVIHAFFCDQGPLLVALQDVKTNTTSATFGWLGETLDSALKTDFITWFHFEKLSTAKDAQDHQVIYFRPTGPDFHDLVTLRITCNDAGRMLGLELVLLRSFVEHKTNGVFAADLAKSFLRDATSMTDLTVIAPLATEIEQGAHEGREIIVAADGRIKRPRPEPPSPGYLTYLGKQHAFDVPLSKTRLHFENAQMDGAASLVISVQPD